MAQFSYARTGLLLADGEKGDIVVVSIAPGSPAAARQIRVGDRLGRIGAKESGGQFYLTGGANGVHNLLGRAGEPLKLPFLRVGPETMVYLPRLSGSKRFI